MRSPVSIAEVAMVLLLGAIMTVMLASQGCGATSPQDVAQGTLTATARGLAKADSIVAEHYTEASEVALREVASMEAFRDAMRPWDRVEAALRGGRATLLAAQAGLNVWVATGDNTDFMRVVKCLAGEIEELAAAIEATGKMEVPASLRALLSIGDTYGSRLCREEVTP